MVGREEQRPPVATVASPRLLRVLDLWWLRHHASLEATVPSPEDRVVRHRETPPASRGRVTRTHGLNAGIDLPGAEAAKG
jgi:hypothetical protein